MKSESQTSTVQYPALYVQVNMLLVKTWIDNSSEYSTFEQIVQTIYLQTLLPNVTPPRDLAVVLGMS